MGNFNKRFVLNEAEGILEECEFRETLKKKQVVELDKTYKELKKNNLIFKIITVLMFIAILALVL